MIHARGCGEQGRASERTWLWAALVRHLVRSLWALVQLPRCVEGGHVLPGHWPRRTQALGTGRTENSLPGRGLGMKPQKELRFRS